MAQNFLYPYEYERNICLPFGAPPRALPPAGASSSRRPRALQTPKVNLSTRFISQAADLQARSKWWSRVGSIQRRGQSGQRSGQEWA